MLKTIVILAVVALLHIQGYILHAQKVKVVTTSIEDIDNKLVIKYDLVDSKESQRFNVSLAITSSTGQIIHANTVTGDLGNKISGGTNKQITWDYTADEFVMKGNLNIEVVALLVNTGSDIFKSMMLSTVWPGLGLYRIDKKKPYLLIGLTGYVCLGTSLYMSKKSTDTYNDYLSNTDDKLSDDLFNKSLSQHKLSKTMAYTAIGIWGINLAWTFLRAKSKTKIDFASVDQKKFLFYTEYDPFMKTKNFTLRYRF